MRKTVSYNAKDGLLEVKRYHLGFQSVTSAYTCGGRKGYSNDLPA